MGKLKMAEQWSAFQLVLLSHITLYIYLLCIFWLFVCYYLFNCSFKHYFSNNSKKEFDLSGYSNRSYKKNRRSLVETCSRQRETCLCKNARYQQIHRKVDEVEQNFMSLGLAGIPNVTINNLSNDITCNIKLVGNLVDLHFLFGIQVYAFLAKYRVPYKFLCQFSFLQYTGSWIRVSNCPKFILKLSVYVFTEKACKLNFWPIARPETFRKKKKFGNYWPVEHFAALSQNLTRNSCQMSSQRIFLPAIKHRTQTAVPFKLSSGNVVS